MSVTSPNLENLLIFEALEFIGDNLPKELEKPVPPDGVPRKFICDIDSLTDQQFLRDSQMNRVQNANGGGTWIQFQSFANQEEGAGVKNIRPIFLARTYVKIIGQTPETKKAWMRYARQVWAAAFKFPYTSLEAMTLGQNALGGVETRRGASQPRTVPGMWSFDLYFEALVFATQV